MALPRTLKNMNVFHDGVSHVGQISEVELPKLTRKTDEFRGGGMDGGVEIDLGQEKIEMPLSYGGLMREMLQQYGIANISGVLVRFAGAYQRDDSGTVDAVEVIARGRWKEIDPGKAKPGDKSEFKATLACTYYKLSVNNVVDVEIDLVNMVFVSGGVDRLADQRRAIGL
ncbi:phage major tail tube protein [Silvimonas sp.]|uniref:phage major tail tube protein n=1 Tax=Silvimonas sp. TaxID=2650811 RepID=UPI00283D947A|nr:phage major tail tube protein [Silvimonas sp.]MDR3429013.1 phage major tail tube protein [Silvimonas sp.]